MGTTKHQRYTTRTAPTWRLVKDNQRQLKCHPSIKVRVKVLEPGIQSRWCERCQDWRYFVLESVPDERFANCLRLRWLTTLEAERYVNALDDTDPRLIMENWK